MPFPLIGVALRVGLRGLTAKKLTPGGDDGPPLPQGGSVKPRIHVENLGEFRRDLKRLDPLIDRELRDAIKDAADKIAVTAGARAPRDSGALAHSIRPFVAGARASVGSALPYAGWIEHGGTIRPHGVPITIRGAHMVGDAVEDHADQLVEDIADGIDRAAYRAGWHPGR